VNVNETQTKEPKVFVSTAETCTEMATQVWRFFDQHEECGGFEGELSLGMEARVFDKEFGGY
jgi:hypothetical protein